MKIVSLEIKKIRIGKFFPREDKVELDIFFGTSINATATDGSAILDEASSATNPTLIPDRSELGTGVGGTSNNLSLIHTGTEILTVQSAGVNITGTIKKSKDLTILMMRNILRRYSIFIMSIKHMSRYTLN